MSDQQDSFGRLWQDTVDGHVKAMSDTDFREMVSRTRPLDPATVRSSIAAKSQAMWGTPRDHNGSTVSDTDAAAAARATQPPMKETR